MNDTPTVEDLRAALLSLSPPQQVAAEALANGETHQAAADSASVARETVTRWAGHIPAFKATLNLYRATLASEQVDTARRIRGKALARVEAALDDGQMNRTRAGLPPAPTPRGLEAQLEALDNPPPSDVERAESLTITRLSFASGLADAAFRDAPPRRR